MPFGPSIQPFNRDPFERPVRSLRSMSGERKSYAHPRRAAPLVALDDHVPRVPPIERTKSWTLSGLSPEVRTRDKPTVSPSGRSFATSTRATGARLKLCDRGSAETVRSEEHKSELQKNHELECRL